MLTAIATLHIIVCVLLIGLVLLQDPKSSGGGGVFGGGGGGGTGSLLGATGAATFLTRLTRYCAIVFGVLCLLLTLMSRPNTASVIDAAPTSIPTGPGERVPGAPPADASAPGAQKPVEQAPKAGGEAPSAPANTAPTGGGAPAPATK